MSSSKESKPVKLKAGVVVYRPGRDGETEILLITARKFPGAWVFPVGSVDQGESLQEAAARECAEESGYEVKVGQVLRVIEIDQGKSMDHFTFFLAQVTGEAESYERDRRRQWVYLSELVETVTPVFAPVARSAATAVSNNAGV